MNLRLQIVALRFVKKRQDNYPVGGTGFIALMNFSNIGFISFLIYRFLGKRGIEYDA